MSLERSGFPWQLNQLNFLLVLVFQVPMFFVYSVGFCGQGKPLMGVVVCRTRLATAAAATATAATPSGMDLDLPVDPNEPTYCFCNQVSYGEMVACDNPNCKIEWFHYGCVGLKEQPKGKWFCADCAGTQKKRKGK
ncbi:hypothetical protein MTR67_041547 [Solanum verrucosum]|uniref:PHD-type domain-containing protein n=1 Tax=Solanum verrucosum TaxID=315347 RepID=A0AAF0UL55_SOLVR|nr:hypothetical protein MTR67_041547 [Solanum verrucosum]